MGWTDARNCNLPLRIRYQRNPVVKSLCFLSFHLVWIPFSYAPETTNPTINPCLLRFSTRNPNPDSLRLLPIPFPFFPNPLPPRLNTSFRDATGFLRFQWLLSTFHPTSDTQITPLSTRHPRSLLLDFIYSGFDHRRVNFHHFSYPCSRSFSTSPRASLQTSGRKQGSFLSSARFDPSAKPDSRHDALQVKPDEISRIVDVIRNGGDDMEAKLNKIGLILSHALVSEVLRVLNSLGVSALRFFNWCLETHSSFKPNPAIYDQIIDNVGNLDDHGKMLSMLKELSLQGHCVTEKAFNFLTFRSYDTAKASITRIVETLNEVRGSCRGSGTHSLIKLLCDLNSFDLAILVLEKTARKTSYYIVLIAAKCRTCDFQDARDLFDEMRRFGCAPSTKLYNYLLGSLFKHNKVVEACDLLQRMEELGYLPDPVTYEVVVYHACRVNRMDFAMEFLNRMLLDGIKPRITTHAALIKGYFGSGRVAEAHMYVVEMSLQDKCSANMNYSLLASLFRGSGRVLEAGGILYEMMEKGISPYFAVYMRTLKDLFKLGRGDLISDLKCRYSKFHHSRDTD